MTTPAAVYVRRMRSHFDARQSRYPLDDVRAVGWSSRASQEARFRVLCEVGALDGCSVLDAGCGAADLYAYLTAHGWHGSYRGIDLSPQIIAHARARFPALDVRVGNVLTGSLGGTHDYVLASGIFFIRVPDWSGLVVRVLTKMLRAARRGVAANFLSRYGGDNRGDYRADPSRVLRLCLDQITPRAVLRHDYRTNDFTVYLYPRAKERNHR